MATVSFTVPTVSEMKKAVMANKVAIVGLAIGFVASIATMIITAYTADHINKSVCGKTDKKAQDAYKWSWVSAVLSAVIAVACAGGIVYMMKDGLKPKTL